MSDPPKIKLYQLHEKAPASFPAIDAVVLSLKTQSYLDWLTHEQTIIISRKYLPGFDKEMVEKVAQATRVADRRLRNDYGGGAIFKSNECRLINPDNDEESVMAYQHPIREMRNWGRLYSSTTNKLIFEVDSGIVENGLKLKDEMYLVGLEFSIKRYFLFENDKYVELGKNKRKVDNVDLIQVLKIENICRQEKLSSSKISS